MIPDNSSSIVVLLLLFFALFFMYWFAKKMFSTKVIDLGEFPNEWRRILQDKVLFYSNLNKEDQQRFEHEVLQFLHDVSIKGVNTKINDEDKLLVASSAVIPLFGFPGWRFLNIDEVLLYPNSFNEDFKISEQNRILGMVGEGAMNRMMILSKPALHLGFENNTDKHNVGIHEFVHLIDKADGDTDGIPHNLVDKQFALPWFKSMHDEMQRIKEKDSDINTYALTNEAEFLSVVSEYFFSRPDLMKQKHSELYNLLKSMFHQDLAPAK